MNAQSRHPNTAEPIRLRPAVLDLIASGAGDPDAPGFDEARFLAQLRAIVARAETPQRRLLAKYRADSSDAIGRVLAFRG